MFGTVSRGYNGFGNALRSMFHIRNEIAVIQLLIACAIQLPPLPPLSLSHSPWRCKNKMATPEQKTFCVLLFAKHELVVSLQRTFRQQFQSDSPSANSTRHWYQLFQTKGCLCKRKSARRPHAPEESVERARQPSLRSPRNLCSIRVVNWGSRLWLCGGGRVVKEPRDEALTSALFAVPSIILYTVY